MNLWLEEKQILCARLRQWPIDRIRRKEFSPRPEPFALVRTVGMRQMLVATCPTARRSGILPGMTLAAGRALDARLRHAEHEPRKDQQGLLALARWMMRFTPVVAVEGSDAIVLDVTGCQRLFGGMPRLRRAVAESFARFRIYAGLGMAPTLGVAWALASFAPQAAPVTRIEDVPGVLFAMPVAALRLEESTRLEFLDLGIETIGQLAALPRRTLPSRFGPQVLLRLDQAFGNMPEPLVPLVYGEPIGMRFDFDHPIHAPEAMEKIFRELLKRVLRELRRRGCGARRMIAHFRPPRGTLIQKTLSLSRPTCDEVALMNLLRCAMESIDGESIAGADGFVSFGLSVPFFQRLADEQRLLLEQDRLDDEREMDHLIERLRLRLGEERVRFPRLVDSHLPERAFDYASEESAAKVVSGEVVCAARPLHLLPQPTEVLCLQAAGMPLSFTLDDQVYPVVRCAGPERICGMWWEGRNKTRDYFDVEEPGGKRFWIFRVEETRRWYVHGIWM